MSEAGVDWSGEPKGFPSGSDLGVEGVDFRSAAGQEVLEHGGTVVSGGGADPAQELFGIGGDGDAGGPGHGLGLLGGGEGQLPSWGEVQENAVFNPEDGGEGVDGYVDQKLFPDHDLDVPMSFTREAGSLKQGHKIIKFSMGDLGVRGDAEVSGAKASADDFPVPYSSGAGEDDASQKTGGAQDPGQGFQVAKTVLEGENDTLGGEQTGKDKGGGRGVVRLDCNNDQMSGGGVIGEKDERVKGDAAALEGVEDEAVLS